MRLPETRTRAALRLASLATFAALSAGCPLLKTYTQKPKLHLQKVDVKDVNFAGATLEALLDVENRIPVGITIGKVSWAVSIEGSHLVGGDLAQGVTIPASAHAPVTIPFQVKFEDLWRISQKYKDQDTAPYRLEGTMDLDTPIGPIQLPFHYDGTVPVLKIPEVDLARVQVRGVNFSGADVRFGFRVRNPNNLALNVQSLDYGLTLAGSKIANGRMPAMLDLPAKGNAAFDADVHVSFLEAATAAQSLASRSTADYAIRGSFAAKTPWGVVSSPYAKSGTVKIQR